MIAQIYLSLILIGSTIGAVLLVLWLQARNVSRISLALIRLNEHHNFDTPVFLRAAWPLLSQAGLRGIAWKLDWFGVTVENHSGLLKGNHRYREIEVAEMKLAITVYQKNMRGERRYFNETLVETFLLLLHTNMWIKAGATDKAFAQMAKLNLFLQHDMKNIAQFIQLMADQLADMPAGKEQKILDYLGVAAPLIRHRADRVVRMLTMKQPPTSTLRHMHLHQELAQLCHLYHLECKISGDAEIEIAEDTLVSVLDNILKNYGDIAQRDHTIKPVLSIAITSHSNAIDITIEATNTPFTTDLERLFEPFWSSDPAGLGIGLYQAKQLLETCGGKLEARLTENGRLQFHLHFPVNNEKT